MEEVGSGAVPVCVSAIAALTRVALVRESKLGVASEVVIPAEFLEPRACRFGAGKGDCRERPKHVEKISGMALFAITSVSGESCASVVVYRLVVVDEAVEKSGRRVFSIVVVAILEVRRAVTVRNGSHADMSAEKSGGGGDALVESVEGNPALASKNERSGHWYADCIYCSVSIEAFSLVVTESVTPSSERALSFG